MGLEAVAGRHGIAPQDDSPVQHVAAQEIDQDPLLQSRSPRLEEFMKNQASASSCAVDVYSDAVPDELTGVVPITVLFVPESHVAAAASAAATKLPRQETDTCVNPALANDGRSTSQNKLHHDQTSKRSASKGTNQANSLMKHRPGNGRDTWKSDSN